jgi:tetratricopeptide (TPR) repeat protein
VFLPALVMSTGLAVALAVGPDALLPDAALLERAEAAFRAGSKAREHPEQARVFFHAAADRYEALQRRGIENPGLCSNLGKAALLAGDLPRAIRAYRRGLRLDPDDRSLLDDLAYARDQVQYPANTVTRPPADPWPSWLPRPADDVLLAVALAFYGVACLAATGWRMDGRSSLRKLGVIAMALALVSGLRWGLRRWEALEQTQHPVVVMAAEATPLRTGNGLSYPGHKGLPSVSRGMEARLQFARGGWLQIEFPGGEVGWVQRAGVLIDE